MMRLTLASDPAWTWETDLARVRLGRARDADVCLEPVAGPVVSERHAMIEFRGDGYWLVDVGSRNGTFLDGERVDAPRPLRDGAVIRLGADTGPELHVAFVVDRERLAVWSAAVPQEGWAAALLVASAAVVAAGGVWLLWGS